jgi:hypothetical protein
VRSKAVLGQQGLITEAGFTEQASSYTAMQKAAGLASQEDTIAAQGELQAEAQYNSAASAENTAATGSFLGAGVKAISSIAAFAGMFA